MKPITLLFAVESLNVNANSLIHLIWQSSVFLSLSGSLMNISYMHMTVSILKDVKQEALQQLMSLRPKRDFTDYNNEVRSKPHMMVGTTFRSPYMKFAYIKYSVYSTLWSHGLSWLL